MIGSPTWAKHPLKAYKVFPVLKNRPIDQITRGEFRDMLLALSKKGYSKSTICLVRDVVSGPFGYAIDEELVSANPATGILKRLKLERTKKLEVTPLTVEETALFLEACRKHAPEHFPFFLTAFRTGMRLGELLALHWGDIDWNSKFINVQRSFKGGRVSMTKTGNTRRVDMSNQLETALKGLLTARKREAMAEGKGEPVEIIFHHQGGYWAQNSARNVFKRMLGKAGLRDMRLHDIRHTFASQLLSNGESPAYVKEQCGHSSINITVDIYGHLIPSSNREAVNRLDSQQSATHTQPPKNESPQPVEIAGNSF